ncbi:HAD family hydrolase [Cognatiluteimonas profundi]|uniref:HAD family hydrolase n=1 Tax=Cognatiluteimonas profundi TaxID=2594501 RepID=UPI00131B7665|nr:HAD family hydrolase [Lysobacter profundi]
MLTVSDGLVFLLDVDNTLLDNDRFSADLDARLTSALGSEGRTRYRALYDSLRRQRGYADYLEPLQQLRPDFVADPDLLQLSTFLLDYPFADLVYPGVAPLMQALHAAGTPVILSDGDLVFQPRKIQRSGLWEAVQGRVHVYLHKEQMLPAIKQAYPARHYVMVDDKPALLAAIKQRLGDAVTTIFVRQGHYATDELLAAAPIAPDVCIGRIGELVDHVGRMANIFKESR